MFYKDEIAQGNCDDGVTMRTWLEAWKSVKSVTQTQLSLGQSATCAMLYLLWAMSLRHTLTIWHKMLQSIKCHTVFQPSPVSRSKSKTLKNLKTPHRFQKVKTSLKRLKSIILQVGKNINLSTRACGLIQQTIHSENVSFKHKIWVF